MIWIRHCSVTLSNIFAAFFSALCWVDWVLKIFLSRFHDIIKQLIPSFPHAAIKTPQHPNQIIPYLFKNPKQSSRQFKTISDVLKIKLIYSECDTAAHTSTSSAIFYHTVLFNILWKTVWFTFSNLHQNACRVQYIVKLFR